MTRGPEHVVSVLVAPKGWAECGRNTGDPVFQAGRLPGNAVPHPGIRFRAVGLLTRE